MTHTARCDDVPYRHPTVRTVVLPSPGTQRLVTATSEGVLVEWELRGSARVWVSTGGTVVLRFIPIDVMVTGPPYQPRLYASVYVDAGTTAIDLPPTFSFGGVLVESEAESQGVLIWTRA